MIKHSTSRYHAVSAARTVKRRRLRTARSVSQPVAVATERLDDRWLARFVELAPQVADINVDNVGLAVELPAPDVLGDLRPAERQSRMAQQAFEHGELAWRQHDCLFTAHHRACADVH